MPVSGLVVSLSNQPDLRQNAWESMRADPRIEVGLIEAQRVAIVVDTASNEEDKTIWNWLQQLPGVVFVDIVMVGFEEPVDRPTEESSVCSGR